MAIYYSNDHIVFLIALLLIYQNDFILYNLIPNTICKGNNCVYIKPSNKILAISKTKKHFSTYDNYHYTYCKHSRDLTHRRLNISPDPKS